MIDLTQPVMPTRPRLPMPFWRRLFIFCALSACCFLCASVLIAILGRINSTTSGLRLVVITQDFVMFIAPAVATGVIVAGPRRIFKWLGVSTPPGVRMFLFALVAYVASIPVMELIVDRNASVQLPVWLKSVEDVLRSVEDSANDSIAKITGAHTIGNLIVSIIIIGMVTGVAEETFFRGGLQRVLYRKGHMQAAVWIAALVFSLLHFQFYGFVPRVLLGALFGYVFLWSGSLWTGITLHALNNIITLCLWWRESSPQPAAQPGDVGLESPAIVVCSVLLTAFALYLMWKYRVDAREDADAVSDKVQNG